MTKRTASLMKMIEEVVSNAPSKESNVKDHILIMIEMDDNDMPSGKIIKAKGGPFQILGMLDSIMYEAEGFRDAVHRKISNLQNFEKGLKTNMPGVEDEMKKKLEDLEKRARKAAESNDDAEMERIMNDMKAMLEGDLGDILKDLNKDEDDKKDDFNFEDFKNM